MNSNRLAAVCFAGALVAAGCASTEPRITPPSGPAEVNSSTRGLIPVGQELDVRLQEPLSSKTATVEQHFDTTTVVDLRQGDAVLIPAGSTVRGIVRAADPAGRIDRTGKLSLAFDRLTVNGRNYELRAMATQAFESGGIRDEGKVIGAAGAVGAVVGGIIGGVKGAVIGAAAGAGGIIAATEGKDVELPAGAIVRLRLDSPVQVR